MRGCVVTFISLGTRNPFIAPMVFTMPVLDISEGGGYEWVGEIHQRGGILRSRMKGRY